MRLLCAIPHFYKKDATPRHGSQGSDISGRITALRNVLFALRQLATRSRCVIDILTRTARPLPDPDPVRVQIAICTTGPHHLLQDLAVPPHWYQHFPTRAEALQLGFECHRILAEQKNEFDWFVYLEDDIVLRDPQFLGKLAWFTAQAGSGALLQPNRYEISWKGPFLKAYVDGDLAPRVTRPFQDTTSHPVIKGRYLGDDITFVRPLNPHSGCFFLNREQLERWTGGRYFLDRDTSFISPLESAATLSVMRTFRIYKPAPVNMDFLEVEHQGSGFISLIGRSVGLDPEFGIT